MIIGFKIIGTSALGQTWECCGKIENVDWPDHDLLGKAMKESFMQLTGGKAIFGKPGVGCRGPYSIVRIELHAVPS